MNHVFERLLAPIFFAILGFLAGRLVKTRAIEVGNLLVYFLSPLLIFATLSSADLAPSDLAAPLIAYVTCGLLGFTARKTAVWLKVTKDPLDANLFGLLGGSANNGYFGLPVALALFGESGIARMMLYGFGFVLFENTLGYYWMARARFGFRESLARLIGLPSLYAFFLAVACNFAGLHIPESLRNSITPINTSIRAAYVLLGMMLVGIGISQMGLASGKKQGRFLLHALSHKFVVWPVAVLGIRAVLRSVGYLSELDHSILLLLSLMPMPANSVAFAATLGLKTESVALAVAASTLTAILVLSLVF